MLKNKYFHGNVFLKRFHLNGHTKGFHPQTQNLEQEANELKVQYVVSENIHTTSMEGIGFSGGEGVHHRDIFLEGSRDA